MSVDWNILSLGRGVKKQTPKDLGVIGHTYFFSHHVCRLEHSLVGAWSEGLGHLLLHVFVNTSVVDYWRFMILWANKTFTKTNTYPLLYILHLMLKNKGSSSINV